LSIFFLSGLFYHPILPYPNKCELQYELLNFNYEQTNTENRFFSKGISSSIKNSVNDIYGVPDKTLNDDI